MVPFKPTPQQASERRDEDGGEKESHEQENERREEAKDDPFMRTPPQSTPTSLMCVTNEEILEKLKVMEMMFEKKIDKLDSNIMDLYKMMFNINKKLFGESSISGSSHLQTLSSLIIR